MEPFRRKSSSRFAEISLAILLVICVKCNGIDESSILPQLGSSLLTSIKSNTSEVTTSNLSGELMDNNNETTEIPSIRSTKADITSNEEPSKTTDISSKNHFINLEVISTENPSKSTILQNAPIPPDDTTKIVSTNSTKAEVITNESPSKTTKLLNLDAITTIPINVSSPIAQSETCTGYNLLPVQPIYSEHARVTKCNEKNITISFAWAIFYDNCIEDLENLTSLQNEIFNPCASGTHKSLIYGDIPDDRLVILQNGSLFRSNSTYTEYDVFDTYCLFADEETGQTLAMVCYDELVSVSRAQAYLYAICMLVSVPCLLATAYFYLAIGQLRNLHGKSLACHCICLAVGFLLLSVVQIHGKVGKKTGYVIQYSLLACFLWLAVMCIDICTHVWYYLPRRIEITPLHRMYRFAVYAVIAQGLPLVLVTLAIVNNLSGMPSYFLKGVTEETRWSQQFFIPPVSSILFVCLVLLIVSYFGFRTLDPIVAKTFLTQKYIEKHNVQVNIEQLNVELYEETKQVAKSTAYLYIIMAMNWMFEIVSFYVSSSASLELFDILNALQGIVIFIIFISLPRPLYIIKHWWIDRGEFNTTEMEQLNRRKTDIDIEEANAESNGKN